MIIVSQDKIRIIDITGKDIEINNPETWNQGFWSIDTYPNCNDSQKYHLRLGIYKTEERAKEVLQEIKLAYANTELLKIPDTEIAEVITAREMTECFCYEMPKE